MQNADLARSRTDQMIDHLARCPTWLLVCAVPVVNLATAFMFLFVITSFASGSQIEAKDAFGSFNRDGLPLFTRVITYVVIGPFLETLLQQYLVARILIGKIATWAVILISMIVFGLFHWQTMIYMIYGFIHGFAYIVLFIVLSKKQTFSPLLLVTLAHGLFNLTVL